MSKQKLTAAEICAECGHKWRAHDDETVWCIDCGAKEKVVTQRDGRIAELEKRLESANDYIRRMDSVIDDNGIARSCINPLEDLRRAVSDVVAERDRLLISRAMENSARSELERLRRDWSTVYQYVMRHAPWTESNDILAVDELLCGIGLLIQERDQLFAKCQS